MRPIPLSSFAFLVAGPCTFTKALLPSSAYPTSREQGAIVKVSTQVAVSNLSSPTRNNIANQIFNNIQDQHISANANAHAIQTSYSSTLLGELNEVAPRPLSTDQQIQSSLPLGGTVRNTRWRIREEHTDTSYFSNNKSSNNAAKSCTSYVTFRGFAGEPNRGTVEYDAGTCASSPVQGAAGGPASNTRGLRWISKTTRVVQLTARWNIKLNGSKLIFKGYIDGGRRRQMEGKSGMQSMEMSGTILTGEETSGNNARVIGKFTADLLDTFDDQ